MELNSVLELINLSDFILQERKDEIKNQLSDAIPHKDIERRNAKETLNHYETVVDIHKLSKKNPLSGMENMIETIGNIPLKNEDFIDEILYFSTNKMITIVVLNSNIVVGITDRYKSEWHKDNDLI